MFSNQFDHLVKIGLSFLVFHSTLSVINVLFGILAQLFNKCGIAIHNFFCSRNIIKRWFQGLVFKETLYLQENEIYFFQYFEVQVDQFFSYCLTLNKFQKVFILYRFFKIIENFKQKSWLFLFIWESHFEAFTQSFSIICKSSLTLFQHVSVGLFVTICEAIVFFKVDLLLHRKFVNKCIEFFADKFTHVIFHAQILFLCINQ